MELSNFRAIGVMVILFAAGLLLHTYSQDQNREWTEQAQKGKGGLPIVRVPQGPSPSTVQRAMEEDVRAASNPNPIGKR